MQSYYHIIIEGCLDQRWADWFGDLELHIIQERRTLLRGELDQAALFGVLMKLRDLGLTLVSIHPARAPDPPDPPASDPTSEAQTHADASAKFEQRD